MASPRTIETKVDLPRTQRVELIAFPDSVGEPLRKVIAALSQHDCLRFGSEDLANRALPKASLLRCIWLDADDFPMRPHCHAGITLALVKDATPNQRANLIRSGYIAVIDLAQVSIDEAANIVCAYAENTCKLARQYKQQEPLEFAPEPFITLEHSESGVDYLAAAVEMLNIGVYAIDFVQGETIAVWNQEMSRLFRISKADAIGNTLSDVFEDPHIISLFRSSSHAHTRNRAIFPTQSPARESFIADISKTLLHDDQEKPTVLVGIIKDITNRIQSENRLIAAFNELEASKEKLELSNVEIRKGIEKAKKLAVVAQSSNRAKSYFLSNISHELRTPLNSIVSLSYALLEGTFGPLNDRQCENLEIVSDSAKHLQSLINDILDLSKIELGKLSLKFATVVIEDLAVSSIRMVEQEAALKRVTCNLDFRAARRELTVDGKRLRQILLNLLVNAIKFTKPNTQVELIVEDAEEHDAVRFKVVDRGIGISQSDFSKIFSPFTQLDETLSRQYEGTGLGLAIASKFVELHGGGLTILSTPGEGSTFSILLPDEHVKREANDSEPSLAEIAIDPELEKRLVVIVDENEHSNALLRSRLDLCDRLIGVDALPNEISAYQDQVAPAAVIVDLNVIVSHGSDWIASSQKLPSWQKTVWIASSSLDVPENREVAAQLGFSIFLPKPISQQTAVSIMKDLLA